MKLAPSLLVFAIAGGVVPAAEAGQKARPDPAVDTLTQPDYLFNTCQDTTSLGDPRSAERSVDPAYMLKNYLYSYSNGKLIADLASIKTTLVQGTTHGELLSSLSNSGRTTYHYNPSAGYRGEDQVTFLADFQGKRYKIVVDLHVWNVPALGDGETCPPPQLIKVNGQPVSGSATDIPTTGTNITLDTNGHSNG